MRALYTRLIHDTVLQIDWGDILHILGCQRYGGIKANRCGLTAGRREEIGEVVRKKDSISEPSWYANFDFLRSSRIPVLLKTVLGFDQKSTLARSEFVAAGPHQ